MMRFGAACGAADAVGAADAAALEVVLGVDSGIPELMDSITAPWSGSETAARSENEPH